MHDTLQYFSKEPIHRRFHQNDLTFGMLYQYAERFVSVFSHDEVVHGKASMLYKMGRLAHPREGGEPARALHPHVGLPGQEAALHGGRVRARRQEWNHEASLDWHLCQYMDHEGVRRLVGDLNRLYTSEPVLGSNDFNPHGFRWISCLDADANMVSYLRTDAVRPDAFLSSSAISGARRGPTGWGFPAGACGRRSSIRTASSTGARASGTMAGARPRTWRATATPSRSS